MANNWHDDRRNRDDKYSRRSDGRTRDFGNGDRESYRAGDEDAHRNDREMAFGNFNQRLSRDQGAYSQHDAGMDRDEFFSRPSSYRGSQDQRTHMKPWERQFGENRYESSRFDRRPFGDYEAPYRPSYAGRGPKGYRRSDERIRDEVSEVLERDHYVDATDVEVEVKEGVVFLRGHIEDRRQKRMAEDAIETITGVKDVRNELIVDQSFFQRAKEALLGGSTKTISDTSKGDLVNKPRH
ncbi:MAG: BON domain-containing protein [Bdellovibrionota bacterium]